MKLILQIDEGFVSGLVELEVAKDGACEVWTNLRDLECTASKLRSQGARYVNLTSLATLTVRPELGFQGRVLNSGRFSHPR